MDPDTQRAYYKARAKVFWGESRDAVTRWLKAQDIDSTMIGKIVNDSFRERAEVIKLRGKQELLIGILILIACTVMAALYGLYKATTGQYSYFNSGKVRGSVSEI